MKNIIFLKKDKGDRIDKKDRVRFACVYVHMKGFPEILIKSICSFNSTSVNLLKHSMCELHMDKPSERTLKVISNIYWHVL